MDPIGVQSKSLLATGVACACKHFRSSGNAAPKPSELPKGPPPPYVELVCALFRVERLQDFSFFGHLGFGKACQPAPCSREFTRASFRVFCVTVGCFVICPAALPSGTRASPTRAFSHAPKSGQEQFNRRIQNEIHNIHADVFIQAQM